jgi:hypothetical protein
MTPVATATDPHGWWPLLLGGAAGAFVSAVVGAGVAAWIALKVVERTQAADRRTGRELAALQAAETMTSAALDAYHQLGGSYDTPTDDLRAAFNWSTAVALKEAALVGYVDLDTIYAFTTVLGAHADKTAEIWGATDLDLPSEARRFIVGNDGQREFDASLKDVEGTMKTVLQMLGNFRARGPS